MVLIDLFCVSDCMDQSSHLLPHDKPSQNVVAKNNSGESGAGKDSAGLGSVLALDLLCRQMVARRGAVGTPGLGLAGHLSLFLESQASANWLARLGFPTAWRPRDRQLLWQLMASRASSPANKAEAGLSLMI